MSAAALLQSVVALGFVLALIVLVAWLVKRYGIDKRWSLVRSESQRLSLIERMTIDPKRQLVLVRRDNKEHLLMLGQTEALVIESYDVEKK